MFRRAEFPQVLNKFGKNVMLGIKTRVRILSPHAFLILKLLHKGVSFKIYGN